MYIFLFSTFSILFFRELLRGEAGVQRDVSSAKLSLSEGVGVHDTGRVDGAIAARSNSSGPR